MYSLPACRATQIPLFEFRVSCHDDHHTCNKMECQTCDKEFCSLCLSAKIHWPKTTEMVDRVGKYLHVKMGYGWAGICSNCYTSLEDFHTFYRKVHDAHSYLEDKSSNIRELNVTLNSENENVTKEPTEISQFLDGTEPSEQVKSDTEIDCCSVKLCDTASDIKKEQQIQEINEKFKSSQKIEAVPSDIEKKMVSFYNIKCEKCEDCKFTSFKMLNRHYMTVHNTQGYIKCCKRNIRVNDKYYLRNHMFKHLQPETCRCRVCGKELSSLVTLKHHMNLHKPEDERPFQCSQCNKKFCCKNDLKNHEKSIHVPESERQDFICDVCGKVFQRVANLKYHLSTVHLQERKYICEVCAKCFTTQSGLTTHFNAAHSSLKPIQCHKCKKWLKTRDTFRKHLQLHKNNSYPCSHCSKICNSSSSLRSHLVKHSEERPHICTVCWKSFKTKTHLKNHSAQHDFSSNYKCPYCPKLFVSMSNFYTHRRRMHSTLIEKSPDNENQEVPT